MARQTLCKHQGSVWMDRCVWRAEGSVRGGIRGVWQGWQENRREPSGVSCPRRLPGLRPGDAAAGPGSLRGLCGGVAGVAFAALQPVRRRGGQCARGLRGMPPDGAAAMAPRGLRVRLWRHGPGHGPPVQVREATVPRRLPGEAHGTSMAGPWHGDSRGGRARASASVAPPAARLQPGWPACRAGSANH